jgi:hypothetical protein
MPSGIIDRKETHQILQVSSAILSRAVNSIQQLIWNKNSVRFDDFAAVIVKNVVFWNTKFQFLAYCRHYVSATEYS